MKKYPYNYLGICITNQDPEYRGRVKIFIPNIMPALYANWTKEHADITLDCVGDNLATGLKSDIVQRLEKILPWAECASPIIGSSVGGQYSNPGAGGTGTFNQNTNGPGSGTGGGTQAANFSGSRAEAFAKMKAAAAAAGSPDPNITASIAMLESGWLQSSMTGRANNPFGQTITQRQIGTNGIIGGTRGADGQLHAVYDSLESAVGHHISKWGKYYTPGNINSTTNSLVGASYNIAEPRWGSWIQGIHGKYNGVAASSVPSVNINDPTSPPDTGAIGTVTVPFTNPEGNQTYTKPQGENIQPSVASQGEPIATTGAGQGNLQAGLAVARKQVGNIYGNTFGGSCHKATRGLVSAALGKPDFFGSGVRSAKLAIGTNYWTRGSYYEVLHAGGTNKTGYRPQEGDIAVTTGGTHGHAKAVVNGQFRSDNLNDTSANVLKNSTEIYRLTKLGRDAWRAAGVGDASLIGQVLPDNPVNNDALDGFSTASDDVDRTRMVYNTTPTQASPIDTTGMAQGMFVYPNPGALLWVFFREGDPLFPVYFAASYGQKEWSSAYQAPAGAAPLYYPSAQDDPFRITNKTVMRFNAAGAIEANGSVTEEQDLRTLTLAHANGAHLQFHPSGSIHYSPNEHMEQVGGNKYSYRLNNESWTQGVDNKVVLGNQFIKVGNPSQENLATIEEIQAKITEVNQVMLQD